MIRAFNSNNTNNTNNTGKGEGVEVIETAGGTNNSLGGVKHDEEFSEKETFALEEDECVNMTNMRGYFICLGFRGRFFCYVVVTFYT